LKDGRQQEIDAERDRKLEEARKQRQIRRQQAAGGSAHACLGTILLVMGPSIVPCCGAESQLPNSPIHSESTFKEDRLGRSAGLRGKGSSTRTIQRFDIQPFDPKSSAALIQFPGNKGGG